MPNVSELHVNGQRAPIDADPERTLLSVLRDDLDLTGAKYGCGEGQCGACTVLVDGLPRRSCTTKVGVIADREITTIEGITEGERLHPLQEAFLEAGAMQCGYCTCGMIMTGVALLESNPSPSREDVIRFMNGNLCRCGTYGRIVTAVTKAADMRKEASR